MVHKSMVRREFLKAAGVSSAAVLLAACQPRVTTPSAPEAEAPKAVDAPPVGAPTREVTISFMGWGGVEEDEGVQAAIRVFEEETPGIRVTWIHTPDRYQEKLLAMIAAGTPPDTAFIGSGIYTTFCRDGLLLDITEQLSADPVVGRKGYFIEPQETERCTWEGRWYGIGSCWVAPHIYYNADIFEAAGIEPPSNDPEKAWDWHRFLEVSRQLTADKEGRHPGERGFERDNIDRWAVNWPLWAIPLRSAVRSNGGTWVDRNTGLIALDKPEATEALQRIADLVLEHHVMPRSAAVEELGMNTTQMLETGKLAMVVDGSWALAWVTKINATLGTGVLPKMKVPATDMQAHFHSAFAATKEPDASWKWLRFLATEFYQLQFCRMGLWLPSQTDLMTEQGLAKWMTLRKAPGDGVHPEGFRQIVTDYVPKYGFVEYQPPGLAEAGPIITAALEAVWIGDMTAQQAMSQAVPQANEILIREQS